MVTVEVPRRRLPGEPDILPLGDVVLARAVLLDGERIAAPLAGVFVAEEYLVLPPLPVVAFVINLVSAVVGAPVASALVGYALSAVTAVALTLAAAILVARVAVDAEVVEVITQAQAEQLRALLLTIEDEQARTIAQNEFIGVYGKSADVLADKFDPALAFATELVRRIA